MARQDSLPKVITDEQKLRAKEARGEAKRRRLELAVLSADALVKDQTPGTRIPGWAMAHVERAKKGSLRGAVAAKCGDCTCWQREEIRSCAVVACPLWAFRPYQSAQ